jgi:hypothetical protein
MVRHVIDLVAQLLDVDRRTNQGREAFEREWPVVLSVPLSPMEADALRFLSSLYPANPAEIARAAVLPFLDPGSTPPRSRNDGLGAELTARVELGLETFESEALDSLADREGMGPEAMARMAMWDTLGPLMDVPRA